MIPIQLSSTLYLTCSADWLVTYPLLPVIRIIPNSLKLSLKFYHTFIDYIQEAASPTISIFLLCSYWFAICITNSSGRRFCYLGDGQYDSMSSRDTKGIGQIYKSLQLNFLSYPAAAALDLLES